MQTVVSTLPSTPKPQTAKELIAADVQLLIEQLEAGHSEGLTAYLTAMGRFHSYSVEQAGPQGEEGRARHPHSGACDRHPPQEGGRSREGHPQANQPVLVGFRSAYVFDVSQTEGAELSGLTRRIEGNVGEYRERLIDFTIAQGIELEFKESIAPALGMSYGGKIAILPGQAPAEEFSTLVQEVSSPPLALSLPASARSCKCISRNTCQPSFNRQNSRRIRWQGAAMYYGPHS